MCRIVVVGAVLLALVMAVGCGKEETKTPTIDTKKAEKAVAEGEKKVEEAVKDADE